MANQAKAAPKSKPDQQAPPGATLSDLMAIIKQASPEEQADFAKMMPQAQVMATEQMAPSDQLRLLRTQGRKMDKELSAQMVVMQLGSVSHPEGWEPKPPEWVSDEDGYNVDKQGRRTAIHGKATTRWLIKWYNGDSFGSQEQFMRENASVNTTTATQVANKGQEVMAGIEDAVDTLEQSGLVQDVTGQQSYLSMENTREMAQDQV